MRALLAVYRWLGSSGQSLAIGILVGAFAMAFMVNHMEPEVRPPVAAVAADTAHPDAPVLALWSEAAGVPTVFTSAVAWEESRHNVSPPRGLAGEVGRFQIRPITAQRRCPKLDVREYYGNLACFLKMASEDYARYHSWRTVARVYNGSGPAAEHYADRIMGTVRVLVMQRVMQ